MDIPDTVHIPILVEPIVKALVEPLLQITHHAYGETYWIVDCTLGGGGHTAAILGELERHPELSKHKLLSLDQDKNAIEKAKIRFKDPISQGRLELAHCRFGEADELVAARPVMGLMADLGFSSDQLEDPNRGLSFMVEGRLDMRLDPSRGQSCREILSQVTETELEQWLREWGEERYSRRIASAIISRRKMGEVPSTTKELADIVVRAVPAEARHGRIHAATRTFQALRIVVNQELEELDRLLNHVVPKVRKGGRVAILSFHSLEDRQVKWKFKNKELFLPLTKKPVQASDEEIRSNPRARSAKLRIAEMK
jgi:16S rRNA (cytosine1402-N4)-methyltransferase